MSESEEWKYERLRELAFKDVAPHAHRNASGVEVTFFGVHLMLGVHDELRDHALRGTVRILQATNHSDTAHRGQSGIHVPPPPRIS